MTPVLNHKRLDEAGQATIEEALQERLRLAIKYTLVQVLEEEVDAFVNASPYQRTFERRDYRNGRYERDLGTSMGIIEELPVPRTRGGFRTELFERYQRRQAELDQAICEMFIARGEHHPSGRSGGSAEWHTAQSVHGLARLSWSGRRVRAVEAATTASALLVRLCGWNLFHRDLRRLGRKNADFSHDWH